MRSYRDVIVGSGELQGCYSGFWEVHGCYSELLGRYRDVIVSYWRGTGVL